MVAKGRLAICCISLSSCCRQRQEKRSRRSTKVSDLRTHKTVKHPISFPWWRDGGGRQGVRKRRHNVKKSDILKSCAREAASPLAVRGSVHKFSDLKLIVCGKKMIVQKKFKKKDFFIETTLKMKVDVTVSVKKTKKEGEGENDT